jgi:thiol-disulfide isomerase/thioredoxin
MSGQGENPAYYDIHADLWRRSWEAVKTIDKFLVGAPHDQVQRWTESAKRAPELSTDQRARLQGYNRTIRVLMLGTPWCLDCARVAPYLKGIVEVIGEKAELRIIDRDASNELRDELKIMGAPRIPRVVILSEDWFEVDRLGDRSLSVYRSRMAREIGRGKDHGVLSPAARQTELVEWVDAVERTLIILRTTPSLRKRYND